jgi:hypothetical protein
LVKRTRRSVSLLLGAFDPDFFAAEPVAQDLENRNLIVDAVDTLIPVSIGLYDYVTPNRAPRPRSGRRRSYGIIHKRAIGIGALFQQIERANERAVLVIVGAEDQRAHSRYYCCFDKQFEPRRTFGSVLNGRLGLQSEVITGEHGL